MISRLTELFREQLGLRGGIILNQSYFSNDAFRSGLLLKEDLIQPGDKIYGGIAMLAAEDGLSAQAHSFAVRQICSNGMISTYQSNETYSITTSEEMDNAFDKVEASLESGKLSKLATRFRQSQKISITRKLPTIAHQIHRLLTYSRDDHREERPERLLMQRRRLMLRLVALMETEQNRPVNHHRRHEPASMFELVNAVTDYAKEVRDPRLAWKIMEYGAWLLENIHSDTEEAYSENISRFAENDLLL